MPPQHEMYLVRCSLGVSEIAATHFYSIMEGRKAEVCEVIELTVLDDDFIGEIMNAFSRVPNVNPTFSSNAKERHSLGLLRHGITLFCAPCKESLRKAVAEGIESQSGEGPNSIALVKLMNMLERLDENHFIFHMGI